MWIIIAACVLTWGGEKLAIPGTEAQKQAEAVFSDVYGQKIKAAKTADDKSALARELLNVAKTESDAANKFVLLQAARKLAVEAQDGTLALEIVKACAETFATPEDGQTEVLLERAEKIWELGQSWRGESQLAARLDAVEQYWRSGNTSALIGKKWEQRIAELQGTMQVVLRAKDARLIGSTKMAYWPDLDAINFWTNPAAFLEWDCRITRGNYEVSVEYAADPPMAPGSLFEVGVFRNAKARVPVLAVRFSLVATGPWATFKSQPVGVLNVREDGDVIVRLRVLLKVPREPLDQGIIAPRAVILRRVQ